MHYEVFSIVEGTHEADDTYFDEHAAEVAAGVLFDDYSANLPDARWEIFILPHYCRDGDDCDCVQHLQDHRPMYSSDDTDETPHKGHWSLFGTYWCDTCNSPYCELA